MARSLWTEKLVLKQIMHSDGFDLLYVVKLEFVKDCDSENLPSCENFGLCCNHFAQFLLEPPILPIKSILTWCLCTELKCTDSCFLCWGDMVYLTCYFCDCCGAARNINMLILATWEGELEAQERSSPGPWKHPERRKSKPLSLTSVRPRGQKCSPYLHWGSATVQQGLSA